MFNVVGNYQSDHCIYIPGKESTLQLFLSSQTQGVASLLNLNHSVDYVAVAHLIFLFEYPWLLRTWRSFSCDYWPLVYYFLQNVCCCENIWVFIFLLLIYRNSLDILSMSSFQIYVLRKYFPSQVFCTYFINGIFL